MKFDKNSKITYLVLCLFYTTFVAVVASSVTTKMFLNDHFNSEKFNKYQEVQMYNKYMDELQEKSREKSLRLARTKDEELERYRQSVMARLNLIDNIDRKIYLLRDIQSELEYQKEKINNN